MPVCQAQSIVSEKHADHFNPYCPDLDKSTLAMMQDNR